MIDTPTIGALAAAAFNMTPEAFRRVIGEPEGSTYASDKYAHFSAIGRAISALGWSDDQIAIVVNAYKESNS